MILSYYRNLMIYTCLLDACRLWTIQPAGSSPCHWIFVQNPSITIQIIQVYVSNPKIKHVKQNETVLTCTPFFSGLINKRLKDYSISRIKTKTKKTPSGPSPYPTLQSQISSFCWLTCHRVNGTGLLPRQV